MSSSDWIIIPPIGEVIKFHGAKPPTRIYIYTIIPYILPSGKITSLWKITRHIRYPLCHYIVIFQSPRVPINHHHFPTVPSPRQNGSNRNGSWRSHACVTGSLKIEPLSASATTLEGCLLQVVWPAVWAAWKCTWSRRWWSHWLGGDALGKLGPVALAPSHGQTWNPEPASTSRPLGLC